MRSTHLLAIALASIIAVGPTFAADKGIPSDTAKCEVGQKGSSTIKADTKASNPADSALATNDKKDAKPADSASPDKQTQEKKAESAGESTKTDEKSTAPPAK